MAEVLKQYRRQLFRDQAAGDKQETEDSYDPVEADQEAGNEQRRRRLLERFRQTDVNPQALQDQVKQKLKAETEKKVKDLATRSSLRIFNIACSATIVLIVVTYIVWTIQMIAGNLLGNPLVPKLALWEQILWGIVSLLLASIIIMVFVLVIVAIRIMAGDFKLIGQLLWDGLRSLLHL